MASHPSSSARWSSAILGVVCVSLCSAFLYRHQIAADEAAHDQARANHFSNLWREASIRLDQHQRHRMELAQKLAAQRDALSACSNRLLALRAERASIGSAAAYFEKLARERDSSAAALELERDTMATQINNFTVQISTLERRIKETQDKLRRSEGNREALLHELKQLQAQKRAVEDQFHNLALLRDRIRHLRKEQSNSRRFAWTQRGQDGLKGGELLRASLTSAAPEKAPQEPNKAPQPSLPSGSAAPAGSSSPLARN